MEQKLKNVYIIHGWEATPDANWFPWLKKELENQGFEVHAPQMPNTNRPDCKEWLGYLQKIIVNPGENTYLIGHSLGVIAILRYLESLPEDASPVRNSHRGQEATRHSASNGVKIGGAILVAGFPEPIGFKELDSFFQTPLNYEKVKKSAKMIVAIHSDNDPYIPVENGHILRDKLGAELIIMPNAGHLNKGDGYFRLPIVYSLITNIQI